MIPIYDMLQSYIKKTPTMFHMPGHKMGNKVRNYYSDIIKWDVTEILETDDLHNPKGAILEAQDMAAKAFGADNTFFLVNGSTCGIHAAIMTVCKRGDKIIVGRDCHKSVLNILTYLSARVFFVNPEYNDEFGICGGYSPKSIQDAVDKNPDSVAVLVTSPNYYGICSNIEDIANIVHRRNKILIVDEAHGAHLNFCDRLPKSAVVSGGDIVVQSAHKTLPALTQTAYLHVNGSRINKQKLKCILRDIQTSSPSFVFLASLDIARHIMQKEGQDRLNNLIDSINEFKNKAKGLKTLDQVKEGTLDKTRLVINFKDVGLVGYDVERILMNRYNIRVEMADLYNIVCITTICDNKASLKKLMSALESLVKDKVKKIDERPAITILDECVEIELRDIKDRCSTLVDLKDSVGEISYNMIVPYPPGIPCVISGQEIRQCHVDYINSLICKGAVVNGICDNGKIEILKK